MLRDYGPRPLGTIYEWAGRLLDSSKAAKLDHNTWNGCLIHTCYGLTERAASPGRMQPDDEPREDASKLG